MGKVNKKKNIKIKKLNYKSLKQNRVAKETHSYVRLNSVENTKSEKRTLIQTKAPKKIKRKQEKCRRKHINLMNKFSLLKKQEKEERTRKNREKTAVVGDLRPLKDALPSLDEIYKLSKERNLLKTVAKDFDTKDEEKHLSIKQKIKKKKEAFVKKVKSFQSVLKDPEFRKNPREAIKYHIQFTHGLLDE